MNFENKSSFSMETARIKSITSSDKLPNVVVTLMSGDVLLIDKNSYKVMGKVKLCEGAIRTSVIVENKEWIVVGTDDGDIVVLDAWTLDIIRRTKAHDDFIRKIIVDETNGRMISVSDDNTTKLWEYEDGIKLVHKYKLGHYGMDVSLCPGDRSVFVVGLLNGKIYLYSVEGGKIIKTFRGHEKGVNCVCFIGGDLFASGSDDTNVFVWDYKRGLKVGEITHHTGMVNSISMIGSSGFCSCSGDGSVGLWNSDLTCAGIKNTKGRAWAALVVGKKLFIGSDNELCVYDEKETNNCICGGNDRILYNTGNVIKSIRNEVSSKFNNSDNNKDCKTPNGGNDSNNKDCKESNNKDCKSTNERKNKTEFIENTMNSTDATESRFPVVGNNINPIIEDIGLVKEIGTINGDFHALKCTKNGRFLVAIFNDHFEVFSTLGLRRKLVVDGSCPFFISNDVLIFVKGEKLMVFDKFEEIASFPIDSKTTFLHTDTQKTIAIIENKTIVLSTPGLMNSKFEKLHTFNSVFKAACCIADSLVLFTVNSIQFYTGQYKFFGNFKYSVASYAVDTENNILYFTTNDKTFYCFIVENMPYFYELTFLPNLVVSSKNLLYFFDLKLKAFVLDIDFYNIQRSILCAPSENIFVPRHLIDRVIAFYESLGLHEKALGLCHNNAQKFEIFLNLRIYDKAFEIADSVAKLTKLARHYLDEGNLDRAAECFYKAKDFNSLFLVDVFSGKKYLDKIAVHAKNVGEKNLAFAAFYKANNYFECAELLKGTPFCDVFKKHYLGDN